ncbi:DcrB-related protein [Pantoea sp. B65]|uniref:DcrB-related protein n=1 Tax=Pantoea sp. B65 TaxID=2813359 RepID=UPI0039B5256C
MNLPVQYVLSEGSLHLPAVVQDQSITVLRLAGLCATLVVTRDWQVTADQMDAFLQQQLQKVKRKMKKFSAQLPEESTLGPLPAQQVAMRFENQGVVVEQQLLVAWAQDHLLALTFSTAGQFTAQQRLAWQAIRQAFIPGMAEV